MDYNKLMEELESCLGLEKVSTKTTKQATEGVKTKKTWSAREGWVTPAEPGEIEEIRDYLLKAYNKETLDSYRNVDPEDLDEGEDWFDAMVCNELDEMHDYGMEDGDSYNWGLTREYNFKLNPGYKFKNRGDAGDFYYKLDRYYYLKICGHTKGAGNIKDLYKKIGYTPKNKNSTEEVAGKSLDEEKAYKWFIRAFNKWEREVERREGDFDPDEEDWNEFEARIDKAPFDRGLLGWIWYQTGECLEDPDYDYQEFVAFCGHYKPIEGYDFAKYPSEEVPDLDWDDEDDEDAEEATEGMDDIEKELAANISSKPIRQKTDISPNDEEVGDAEDETEPTPEEVFTQAAEAYLKLLLEDQDREEALQAFGNLIDQVISTVAPAPEDGEDQVADTVDEETPAEECSGKPANEGKSGPSLVERLKALSSTEGIDEEVPANEASFLNSEVEEVLRLAKEIGLEDNFGVAKLVEVTGEVNLLKALKKYKEMLNKEPVVEGENCEDCDPRAPWKNEASFEAFSARMIDRYKQNCGKDYRGGQNSATEGRQDVEPAIDENALTRTALEFGYNTRNLRPIVVDAIKKGVI